jgi:hypothetical protein
MNLRSTAFVAHAKVAGHVARVEAARAQGLRWKIKNSVGSALYLALDRLKRNGLKRT